VSAYSEVFLIVRHQYTKWRSFSSSQEAPRLCRHCRILLSSYNLWTCLQWRFDSILSLEGCNRGMDKSKSYL